MIWALLATMTGLAIALALWPLVFGRAKRTGSASEVGFYRAQLAEIDRDVERGQLPIGEAAGARAEVARRLIAADAAASQGGGRAGDWRRQRAAAALGAVLVACVGAGVYARFGAPNLPDAPLASR